MLSSMAVDLKNYVDLSDEELKELGVTELVYYPVLAKILEENEELDDIKDAIKREIHELIPKHITKEDILASINYNMHLEYGLGTDDDIDHLGNRRIRAVGELLQNQYRIGLSRLERVVRERMTTQDLEGISPQSLINIKPVTAAVKEFFGSCLLYTSKGGCIFVYCNGRDCGNVGRSDGDCQSLRIGGAHDKGNEASSSVSFSRNSCGT